MNKNQFIIITGNKYPEEDAGAVRQHSFAKILQKVGMDPIVIGIGKSTDFSQKVFDGIKYYSVRYKSSSILFRALGRRLFSFNVMRIISHIQPCTIRGILLVSGDLKTFREINKFAKKYDIQLYHDSVEWYSPSEFEKGEKDKSYRINNLLNTEIIDESYKVFSISTYLERYYLGKRIRTIRIPVIMDVKRIPYQKNTLGANEIRIIYAGSIGGKDHINEMIIAISHLSKTLQERLKFFVIGISKKEYIEKYGSAVNDSVVFLGRISRKEVMEYYKGAAFSFLLRPKSERYAMAGFPTKIVESLSTGTPVLCNLTSDLDQYLVDGENSIIIDDCSVEACEDSLLRIVNMPERDLIIMQEKARKTAESFFDWRNYTEHVLEFINS